MPVSYYRSHEVSFLPLERADRDAPLTHPFGGGRGALASSFHYRINNRLPEPPLHPAGSDARTLAGRHPADPRPAYPNAPHHDPARIRRPRTVAPARAPPHSVPPPGRPSRVRRSRVRSQPRQPHPEPPARQRRPRCPIPRPHPAHPRQPWPSAIGIAKKHQFPARDQRVYNITISK